MKDLISVQFWELDAFLAKEIDLRLIDWQSTLVIYSSEMSFVRRIVRVTTSVTEKTQFPTINVRQRLMYSWLITSTY